MLMPTKKCELDIITTAALKKRTTLPYQTTKGHYKLHSGAWVIP